MAIVLLEDFRITFLAGAGVAILPIALEKIWKGYKKIRHGNIEMKERIRQRNNL